MKAEIIYKQLEVPSKIYTPIIININKNISNENIYTWYIFATEIFKEVELLIKIILKILTNSFYLSRIHLKIRLKKL